jgi:glyoxylate/hydroxypyruvate reductase A
VNDRTSSVAFVAQGEDPARWLPALRAALPRERLDVWPEIADPAAIDVALVARPPAGALRAFPNLRLIQSLWMGVDGLLADATLPRGVPLARLVDPGMVAAMSETVLAGVLDWHRHLYRYRAQQAEHLWKPLPQALASDRRVGLLGLGELGRDAAAKLLALGFGVGGWSRRPRAVPGVECFAGEEGLRALLERSGALVCLLPLTASTRGILNAPNLARLPEGACVINVGRGGHLVERDLLAALGSGHLAHAYLDVFDTEPLPAGHPFWTHPGITLTPHVAALTEPRTAVAVVAENVQRVRRGQLPRSLVDSTAGY